MTKLRSLLVVFLIGIAIFIFLGSRGLSREEIVARMKGGESREDMVAHMIRTDSALIRSAEDSVRARATDRSSVRFADEHVFHAGDTVWVCGSFSAAHNVKPQRFVATDNGVRTESEGGDSLRADFKRRCALPMNVKIPGARIVTK